MHLIMKECDSILEMTNRKIADIERDGSEILDSDDLDDLLDCVNILVKMAKIKCIAHELGHGEASAAKKL